MTSYRQVGGRLGAYVRANDPSTQQIQALLGDLLAGDDLLLPMRDLVARPCFGPIRALAGSGEATIQRDACLNELARTYLPAVVDQIGQLLNGMLDKPAGPTLYAQKEITPALNPKSKNSTTPATENTGLSEGSTNKKLDNSESPEWGWGQFANEPLPGWRKPSKRK